MVECSACGAELQSEAEFCHSCGNSVEPSTERGAETTGQEERSNSKASLSEVEKEDVSDDSAFLDLLSNLSVNQVFIYSGIIVVGVGSLLPWVGFSALGFSTTFIGVDTIDGMSTVGMAIAVFIISKTAWRKEFIAVSLLLSAAIVVVGLAYINDPLVVLDKSRFTTGQLRTFRASANLKSGTYLTIFGGVSMVVGSFRELAKTVV